MIGIEVEELSEEDVTIAPLWDEVGCGVVEMVDPEEGVSGVGFGIAVASGVGIGVGSGVGDGVG